MKSTNLDLQKLNITAMLVAIEFILVRYLKVMIGGTIRISFGFIPMVAVSILYGPLWSGIAFALSDILGATLVPIGIYHPGFTFSAFLKGFIFGMILHKRDISWKNITIASIIVVFGINLALDSIWLAQIFNKAYLVLLPARVIKCATMLPIEISLIYYSWHRIFSKIPYVKTLRHKQLQEQTAKALVDNVKTI